MSIEHDQSTRKAMRAGISGENVLRPLDEFSVTTTEKPSNLTYVYGRVDLSTFTDELPRGDEISLERMLSTDTVHYSEAELRSWLEKKFEDALRTNPDSMITGTGVLDAQLDSCVARIGFAALWKHVSGLIPNKP